MSRQHFRCWALSSMAGCASTKNKIRYISSKNWIFFSNMIDSLQSKLKSFVNLQDKSLLWAKIPYTGKRFTLFQLSQFTLHVLPRVKIAKPYFESFLHLLSHMYCWNVKSISCTLVSSSVLESDWRFSSCCFLGILGGTESIVCVTKRCWSE